MPHDEERDGQLIERVAAGDREAFERLYRRYARPVLGLALRRLSDRGRAEDALQDAFAAVWRSAARYDPERGEGTDAARRTARVLATDAAGNSPMRVRVRGLEPNGPGFDYYELWLTKDGELLGSCGRFKVRAGLTEVSLSVPYPLEGYDGWVVTRGRSKQPLLTT